MPSSCLAASPDAQLAVKPLVTVPVDVVHREGLDVAQGAQRAGPKRRPGGHGLVLVEPDRRLRGDIVVGVTDRADRSRKSLQGKGFGELTEVYWLPASLLSRSRLHSDYAEVHVKPRSRG